MGEIWKSIYLDHRFFFASGSFSSKGKLKRQKKNILDTTGRQQLLVLHVYCLS
jgi:hypothetical protein